MQYLQPDGDAVRTLVHMVGEGTTSHLHDSLCMPTGPDTLRADDKKEPEESGSTCLPRVLSDFKTLQRSPELFFNVLKKNINESLFYPRRITPAFIRMRVDPLIDLQVWERVTYVVLSVHVALFLTALVISSEQDGETDATVLWIASTMFSLPVKLLVSNPMLTLFLATKGRAELAKGEKCYKWWGWGLIFALLFCPIFIGIGSAGAAASAEESYGKYTFWGIYGAVIVEFIGAEITGPWVVSFYAVLKWLLIPRCMCCLATKTEALQVNRTLHKITGLTSH